MFKDAKEGQTNYCLACEQEAKGYSVPFGHTCNMQEQKKECCEKCYLDSENLCQDCSCHSTLPKEKECKCDCHKRKDTIITYCMLCNCYLPKEKEVKDSWKKDDLFNILNEFTCMSTNDKEKRLWTIIGMVDLNKIKDFISQRETKIREEICEELEGIKEMYIKGMDNPVELVNDFNKGLDTAKKIVIKK